MFDLILFLDVFIFILYYIYSVVKVLNGNNVFK